jgi:hypothetical protein
VHKPSANAKKGLGHVELDSDGPGPGIPRVYSLALGLAHSDDPGPGTHRVSSLAVVAAAMGRFKVVLAAANSPAASVSDQHAERTAVCLSATHGRVAHSF